MDDVTAWSILAFVVAIANSTSLSASAFNLSLVVVFIAVMLGIARPGLPRWIGREDLAAPQNTARFFGNRRICLNIEGTLLPYDK